MTMDVIVLGRKLGTASGWDGDNDCIWFYDFEPAPQITLQAGTLYFYYGEGVIAYMNEAGETIAAFDAADFCHTLPRLEPIT